MFKLIEKEDSKKISNFNFEKDSKFLKDSIAFFDVYSNLCDKNLDNLPKYCIGKDGKFSLDGICLFIKTYASEFSFESLDPTIDYLKLLYYSIARLSQDESVVERDFVVNEYLIFKEANARQSDEIRKEFSKSEKKYKSNLEKFSKVNNRYAKNFVAAGIFNVLAIVVIITSFFVALFPMAFYFAEAITFKRAIVLAVAMILIGLILNIEFKVLCNYLSNLAKDDSYSLQMLKRNKDDSFKYFTETKIKYCKILNENYEFDRGLQADSIFKIFNFDEVLEISKKNTFINQSDKDVLTIVNDCQKEIDRMGNKISLMKVGDVGRLENLYLEIVDKDHLKFNKYIKICFLDRFIENAKAVNHWKLELKNELVDPFGVDTKNLFNQKIAFLPDENSLFLAESLELILSDKKTKRLQNLKIHNINNDLSFEMAKQEYISHFYDYQKLKNNKDLFLEPNQNNNQQKKVSQKTKLASAKIPDLINIKLELIKKRMNDNLIFKKNSKDLISDSVAFDEGTQKYVIAN